MALQWITGFEHGVLSTSGGGICDAITGSPSVQSTIKRTGDYALKLAPSAAYEYVRKNLSGSPTYIVGRNYVYFDDLPNESPTLIIGNAVLYFRIGYNSGVNKFTVRCGAGTTQYSSMTLSADTWYRIDFRMWCGDENWYIDWQINGTAQTQATYTNVASSFTHIDIGNSDSAKTYVLYVDDVIISDSPSDYPFGEGQVIGISPNAEGTHGNAGETVCDHNDNPIDGSTYTAYDKIDEVPLSSGSDYIKQTQPPTSSDYVEVQFADMPAASQVNGVMGLLAYMAASTQSNEGACIARDSEATETEIWGTPASPQDYSESSLFYKSAVLPAPSGGWDQAEVNALRMRMGRSGDANPEPYWVAVMFEVDYVPGAAAYTLIASGDSYSLGGQSQELQADRKIIALGDSYGLSGQSQELQADRKIIASPDSYSLTGQTLNLLFARKIIISPDSYTLTGTAYELVYGGGAYELIAEGGTFTLTGQTQELLAARKIIANGESYVLSGQDSSLLFGKKIIASGDSYVLTGQAQTLIYGLAIIAESGTFNLTGTAQGLLLDRIIPLGSGSYVLTGTAYTLTYSGEGGYTLVAEGTSYVLSGQALNLLYDHLIEIQPGSFVLTGQVVELLKPYKLTAEGGSYILTGQTIGLLIGHKLIIESNSYTLSGQDLSLLKSHLIELSPGVYALTGSDITLDYSGLVLYPILFPVDPRQRVFDVKPRQRIFGPHKRGN